MNLPNALTVGRIAATPLIAVLPFANSWALRLTAFILFLVAAITDYIDGHLARSRKQETDLGRLLDPLADKLLLVGTFVPMYLLAQRPSVRHAARRRSACRSGSSLVVLGREAVHDALSPGRGATRRRDRRDRPGEMEDGVPIDLAGLRLLLVLRRRRSPQRKSWDGEPWRAFAMFNGTVGTLVDDRRRRCSRSIRSPSTCAASAASSRPRVQK